MTVYINKNLSSRFQCLLYDVVSKLYTIIIHGSTKVVQFFQTFGIVHVKSEKLCIVTTLHKLYLQLLQSIPDV